MLAVHLLVCVAGCVLIVSTLWDVFEVIVLPRQMRRRVRLARLFYRYTWLGYSAITHWGTRGDRRETALSFYGPLSLLLLLVVWVAMLICGFALVHWGLQTQLQAPSGTAGLGAYIYLSGTTIFTLGLGDLVPLSTAGRIVTVAEGGTGFGLLGLVIGYLPVLYQSFSRREVGISLLDSRAGSPPSAIELLHRFSSPDLRDQIGPLVQSWELWAADLLESHLSYPSVAYFRSQHEQQSWVAALTAMLDTCAIVMTGIDGVSPNAARFTFAMGCHAAIDLSQIFADRKHREQLLTERLPAATWERLRAELAEAGLPFYAADAEDRLRALRAKYEPYVIALAYRLRMPLPTWQAAHRAADDWDTTAWREYRQSRRP